MNITDVRVRLMDASQRSRLLGFCTITIDGDFVVRDLKIIEGPHGPFVAMPNRKVQDRCGSCGSRNNLRARFCGDCGARLGDDRVPKDPRGRNAAHVDLAHPITTECRRYLEKRVVEEYQQEVERSQRPGYRPAPIEDAEAPPTDHSAEYPPSDASDFGSGIF